MSKTFDSSKLLKNSKKRVHNALNNKITYRRLPIPRSTNFLRNHIAKKLQVIVVIVDLVGSTKMSEELSAEKLCTMIRMFCQEMSYVIEGYDGRVLKFVGDAVIGYFVVPNTPSDIVKNTILCSREMLKIIEYVINPISKNKGLSTLGAKICLDYGECNVVLYSADKQKAHVDLIGHVLNRTSKMQNITKPNEIVIGDNLFELLPKNFRNSFKKINSKNTDWIHTHSNKKRYNIFSDKK